MCEMHRSERNAIVRNRERDYVGLFVDPEADHNTVIITAAELLDLNPGKCSLVNLNGCKVVDRPIVEGLDFSHECSVTNILECFLLMKLLLCITTCTILEYESQKRSC